MFICLMGMNYVADKSVADVVGNMTQDLDLSEYGIFVNADDDEIEAEEEELRSMTPISTID